MKLVLFDAGRAGVLTDRGVVDVTDSVRQYGPRNGEETMEAIIVHWDEVKAELERLAGSAPGVPLDRKSTRLNSSHSQQSRMPSSA